MVLSHQQVQERLKNPAAKAALSEAVDHENRIKLHTKAVDRTDKAPPSFQGFLNWVNSDIKLPPDKQAAFKGMCRFPLPTTALCNGIFEEYEKIFYAQDSYRDYHLLDDKLSAEFKTYIETTIKIKHYFETKGFDAYKKQTNCIYIVDLPDIQLTLRPQPYFYKVPISKVIDIETLRTVDNKERIGFIAYKYGHDRAIVIDDASYRVFEKADDKDDWRFISEAFHNLGYTPAKFFAGQSLYDEEDNNTIARKIIMSDSIGDLDWLLFYTIAERMYETYGPFPILTVPESNCTFQDAQGNACTSGIVSYVNSRGDSSYYPCPACQKNNIVGPGTVYGRATPRSKDDPQLPAAVEITPADIQSLDYITKKIDLLEWQIYSNCVGSDDDMLTREAINMKQVAMTFEGKQNVLMRVKKDFEDIEKFIIDTMGRLMYQDYYVTCSINYGEQFLLYSAGDVTIQYIDQKKAGLPSFLVDQKKMLLLQTENKNNPHELQRSMLMNMLEPFSGLSLSECQTYGMDVKFAEKFLLKLDFAKFVSKFEVANGDILSWGSALTLENKINRLTEILLNYVKTELTTQQSATASQATQTAGSGQSTQQSGKGGKFGN